MDYAEHPIDTSKLPPRLRIMGELINKGSISSWFKNDCTHDFDYGHEDEDLGKQSMCFFCAFNLHGRSLITIPDEVNRVKEAMVLVAN